MPVLTEVEKRTGSVHPKEAPEEDSGYDGSGNKEHMVLVGVQKNPLFEQSPKKEDWLRYNFSVLFVSLEKPLRESYSLGFGDARYLFFDQKCGYIRFFDYGFLSNINGGWYTLLLRDEKSVLDKKTTTEPTGEGTIEDALIGKLELDIIELSTDLNKLEGIELTGNPLIFIQSYLGKRPIIVDCEGYSIEMTEGISEINEEMLKEMKSLTPQRHRKYFTEKFMKFEKEFPNFITLNKGDLPEKIANYHLMGLDGREIT